MQVLKSNIRLQIERAALQLFATRGYDFATMADIAAQAGISTGNLYRYHSKKEELLYALISESFVENCLQTLQQKIDMVKGMNSDEIALSKSFRANNTRLLRFLLDNRQKILILMRGCSSTRWADFRNVTRQTVIDKVLEHFASLNEQRKPGKSRPDHVLLSGIYDNLINITIAVLGSDSDRQTCYNALQGILAYHLRGMSAFC